MPFFSIHITYASCRIYIFLVQNLHSLPVHDIIHFCTQNIQSPGLAQPFLTDCVLFADALLICGIHCQKMICLFDFKRSEIIHVGEVNLLLLLVYNAIIQRT